jgi:hypothetical protein
MLTVSSQHWENFWLSEKNRDKNPSMRFQITAHDDAQNKTAMSNKGGGIRKKVTEAKKRGLGWMRHAV